MSKPKPVLALQHAEGDPPGYLGEILAEHGIACDVVPVEEHQALPEVEAYGAVIALGGPQHVGHDADYPELVPEYALIQRAVQLDIPYLGLCLGGQLLAHVLGAPVTALERTVLAMARVEFTPAGQADPLYQGLPGHQFGFEWHEDSFALPPAAVRLATNANSLNQAFRFSRRAYGLQYHIELTPELLDYAIYRWKDLMIAVVGLDGHARLEQSVHALLPAYQQQSRLLFENFLKISGLL